MAGTDIFTGQNGDGAPYLELAESNNNSIIKVYPFDGLAAESTLARREPGVGGIYQVMPAVVLLTAQSADIGETPLVTAPNSVLSLPVGLYRVTVAHWAQATADPGSRLRTTISWTNPIGSGMVQTVQPAPEVDLSIDPTSPTVGEAVIVSVGGGASINYRCELLFVSGGPPLYAVYISLQALLVNAA